jgi:galactokinase/mevalonate kinase-like predicted kinase
MKAQVSVRVPGKVMLCGEYSVLTGGRALAASLDRHLSVRVRPKAGLGGIHVASDIWDEPRFVRATDFETGDALVDTVRRGMELFGVSDMEVRIDSELDIKLGLGSSSALRLGVLLALEEMGRLKPTSAPSHHDSHGRSILMPLAKEAYLLQKKSQARASGYDVATQLIGGLVSFEKGDDDHSWPRSLSVEAESLQRNLSTLVHLFGGGAGAPTTPVMTSTFGWLEARAKLRSLDEANSVLREAFLRALSTPDNQEALALLCAATGEQRRIFADAPSYPRLLAERLTALPGCDKEWSFKTTGAGGEDAVLLLGHRHALSQAEKALKDLGWQRIAVGFECAGTRVTRGATPHA